ncbi:bifunctional DNA-binding transcriptional regulator/O6-methylguanine-DNA methyltransferase Ada [Marinobacter halodurans]|uniref:Bifunctional DNA-binding transcriptional regulator/O6-methylguanine-DNA methyltransferase Ada n=1 Tax=Marinobacter halodurans TaxID=2528979 RepID=A0ABY1ZT37_9GAMM|nr:bifunctional DNA-binding transcriptional regulator/O6-methylguanine-DNA methyltransferase Ada [Marinobacter halodurans]TBW58754.1 bifunctional DNA-binding transcriptional regulator/O6-methylguanine-DNA methyltransferase Ada [Marinobacter halodurans]
MPTRTPAAAITDDPRWPLLQTRDPAADGAFVYSVRTTGVYCRPNCPSRLAKPENIAFHASPADAERAGFRPCRRCRPHAHSPARERDEKVAAICRLIEAADSPPDLETLGHAVGWSPAHLQRTFKAVTGISPKDYAAERRAERVRSALAGGESVTDAIYTAGYGSSGRFYSESNTVLGMTPGRYRTGGAGTRIRFAVGSCSLGAVLVAQSEAGICAILLGDDPDALVRDLQDRFPAADLAPGDRDFETVVSQVVGFVEAPELGLDLPLDIRGTAFQRRVWEVLRQIPPGQTLSYTQVAERIGSPRSVRAVAGACAANRLACAIPCHRVVRNDGGLSGYRWGVERKRRLLEHEAKAAAGE